MHFLIIVSTSYGLDPNWTWIRATGPQRVGVQCIQEGQKGNYAHVHYCVTELLFLSRIHHSYMIPWTDV
jgi:hypothetical protein